MRVMVSIGFDYSSNILTLYEFFSSLKSPWLRIWESRLNDVWGVGLLPSSLYSFIIMLWPGYEISIESAFLDMNLGLCCLSSSFGGPVPFIFVYRDLIGLLLYVSYWFVEIWLMGIRLESWLLRWEMMALELL